MSRGQFQKNLELDALLTELREYLEPGEQLARSKWRVGDSDDIPVVFIHGAHRAGTTLLLQSLAMMGIVSYPTNLMSRFYGTPGIGARIQQLLTDPRYSFRDELFDLQWAIELRSENGKTRGALAPNEFWYFWRRFLPDPERDHFNDEEILDRGDLDGLWEELAMLGRILGKPFALKALIMNQNIPVLAERFGRALFINIHREPVFNMQSALEARRRQFGDIATWYSFRIREYPRLKDLDPLESVAGQIAAIRRSIEIGLQSVPPVRQIDIPYEEYCKDPARYCDQVAAALQELGAEVSRSSGEAIGPFACTNQWRLEEYTREEAEATWTRMRQWAQEEIR